MAYPEREKYNVTDTVKGSVLVQDMGSLNGHITSLMSTSIADTRTELQSTTMLPEYQLARQQRSFHRVTAVWASRNYKVAPQGARDEKGEVTGEADKAASIVLEQLKKVAEEKSIYQQKARDVLDEFAQRLTRFRCILLFDNCFKIFKTSKDLACGPDGIPCSAWRNSSRSVLSMLHR